MNSKHCIFYHIRHISVLFSFIWKSFQSHLQIQICFEYTAYVKFEYKNKFKNNYCNKIILRYENLNNYLNFIVKKLLEEV